MLSVIIPTCDEFDVTVAHVRGCLDSSYHPDEIIVVNDGGEDSLRDKLIGFGFPIIYAKIIQDIPWNQPGARNLGLFLSSGDVLAIEDNDHIPERNFYADAIAEIFGGADRVLASKRLFINKSETIKPSNDWIPYTQKGTHKLIGLYTREILMKMKGFDEQFSGHYGWDVADILRKLSKLGCKETNVGKYYMVADAPSRIETRPTIGTKYKMEKENYGHLSRNTKNAVTQSPVGMLNFNFTYERLV